jgi:hypothetical protein
MSSTTTEEDKNKLLLRRAKLLNMKQNNIAIGITKFKIDFDDDGCFCREEEEEEAIMSYCNHYTEVAQPTIKCLSGVGMK